MHVARSLVPIMLAVATMIPTHVGAHPPSTDEPVPTVLADGSPTELCRYLTDLVTLESHTRFDDLVAIRDVGPVLVELLVSSVAAAPGEVFTDVEVLRDHVIFSTWQSAASVQAGQNVVAWAEENCPTPIDAEAAREVHLVLCLPGGVDVDDVQALWERISTPHPSGRGTELLDGIQSAGANRHGLAIRLASWVAAERQHELVELLGAPPVVAVVEGRSDVVCP